MRHLLAVVVAVGALVTAAFWPQSAEGLAGYYDTNCAQCHGPVRTCDGCHAHGTHGLAGKGDFNVTAAASKFSYAPGEDVVVTVTGGYRNGWVRMLLLDQAQNQVARASGPGGLGNGPDLGAPGGIVLRATAPTQPGVYTWYAAWYGNKFDVTEAGTGTTAFGPMWKDGPGASH